MTQMYIVEIEKKTGNSIWIPLKKSPLKDCRAFIMNNLPKDVNARAYIYKTDDVQLNKAYSEENQNPQPSDKAFWTRYIKYNAKRCELILWRSDYKTWCAFENSSDPNIIPIINSDGTVKKVKGPLQYLNIPSLDTTVSWTYSGKTKYITVNYASKMEFYFTMNGKCIEIWDVHTGEEAIYEGKDVEEMIEYYYKGIYEKRILPSLKKFMTKLKNWK